MPLTSPAMADLTAKAKIRHIAHGLFAKKGFAATSLRLVAQKAGVSPALIAHHYGSKEGLRVAVDHAVMKTLRDQFNILDFEGQTRTAVMQQFAMAINRVVVGNTDTRTYIRRSFLEDGRTHLLDDLLELVARTLERMQDAGLLRPVVDRSWRAMQVLLILFGPTLFEPALKARVPQLFGVAAIDQRMEANIDLFEHGLLA